MTDKRYIKLLLWSVGLGEMDKCEKAADALIAKGFRRQSEVEWIYEWLYECLPGTDAPLAYKCSSCGEFATDSFSYCPNCGAHMKGEPTDVWT